jgi:hypothetical protein
MGEGLVGGIIPIGIWDMGHGTWDMVIFYWQKKRGGLGLT